MFHEFEPSSIHAAGWYRDQLLLQAQGLCGNLDKMWHDVRDSAWIGGDGEGWERVPYWLDGFLPLGYLLGDEDLIARGKRYIDEILARQDADGWICPGQKENRGGYDLWAYFLIGKVLTVYYGLTGDEAVYNALYRAMKRLYEELKADAVQLHAWGGARWFEAMIPLCFLFERTGENWLRELGKMIRERGMDWNTFRDTWTFAGKDVVLHKHIVNVAMMFKYEAVAAELFGEEITGLAEDLWQYLERYNGTALATFTGDEHLAGIGPSHGFELCSVCELMYCYELLYFITENPIWADRLEKAAFNALPATISDDMWRHQYDQMPNQINAPLFEKGHVVFHTNEERSMLFGIEPEYGCCTVNMAQGWPKFGLHAYRKTDGGIEVVTLLPTVLETEINGVPVKVEIKTEYPFRMQAEIEVTAARPVDFSLRVRIPGFADGYTVNGEKRVGTSYSAVKTWDGVSTLSLRLETSPRFAARPNGLYTVEYGPLVFSLPIKVRERLCEKKEDEYLADMELIGESEWRYGFADDKFEVSELPGDDVPFSSKAPRVVLKTRLARVDWRCMEEFDTVAEQTPVSNKAIAAPEPFDLWPYGCAKLRMTEMPRTV